MLDCVTLHYFKRKSYLHFKKRRKNKVSAEHRHLAVVKDVVYFLVHVVQESGNAFDRFDRVYPKKLTGDVVETLRLATACPLF